MDKCIKILDSLISRYKVLDICRNEIECAFNLLKDCYENNGKLLLCGNGGSAADSSHIAGELMKGFMKKRELSDDIKKKLKNIDPENGDETGRKLQGALPAIALNTNSSIITAVINDMEGSLIYAQQVIGLGNAEDVLMCISTSGNASNVLNAAVTAKACGLKVIGLTGRSGGKLVKLCDTAICVPEDSVPLIQELHVPVYHALCAMIEEYFFPQ